MSTSWHASGGLSSVIQRKYQARPRARRSVRSSHKAQETLSSTASNYNVPLLMAGQAVAALAAAISLSVALPLLSYSVQSVAPFLSITITYGIMMFASSYVEEEQNFWYWASSGWLALLTLKGTSRYLRISSYLALGAGGALLGLRVSRRWNQTGQKFAGESDIGHILANYPLFMWDIVALAYLWNGQSLAKRGFARMPRPIAGVISAALLVVAVTFKLAFTNEDAPELIAGLAETLVELTDGIPLVTRARAVFISIALATAYTINFELAKSTSQPKERISSMHTIHSLITLLLMTQSRVTNVPLVLIFEAQLYLLNELDFSLFEITTTSLLLQYMSFFAFGGSNAISSVDLSSAYNGVSGYNVLAVGILTFVSNWAGPIFWTSATNLLLLRLHQKGQKNVFRDHITLMTLFVTFSLVCVMVACTILRTHLFIWTVFSPKYLYSMAWSLGQHLSINIGFGSLLFWAGSR